jgi:hypothetical protein|tara:strand:- start:466 stop:627 length:162 start_codon:yes stop_codon:yes gene_type:complete
MKTEKEIKKMLMELKKTESELKGTESDFWAFGLSKKNVNILCLMLEWVLEDKK